MSVTHPTSKLNGPVTSMPTRLRMSVLEKGKAAWMHHALTDSPAMSRMRVGRLVDVIVNQVQYMSVTHPTSKLNGPVTSMPTRLRMSVLEKGKAAWMHHALTDSPAMSRMRIGRLVDVIVNQVQDMSVTHQHSKPNGLVIVSEDVRVQWPQFNDSMNL